MPFSPVRYRSVLSGLLIAASATLPALSAVSQEQQQYKDSSFEQHCGATSPRLLMMGDDYFDPDVNPLDALDLGASQPLSQEELLTALQPRRYDSGTGQRTDCFGSGDTLHSRSNTVTLEDIASKTVTGTHSGENQTGAGAIVIEAFEYDEKRRISRPESMFVPLSAIAIETFSGLLISSRHRQRHVTAAGSYLRETELTALQTDNELILEQNVYVNGTLAQWTTWQVSL